MDAVTQLLRGVNAWFWDETFWFPAGINWTMIQSTHDEQYPNFGDLKLPIFFAFIVLFIRAAFEWCIARPLGRACGIVDTGSQLNVITAYLLNWWRNRSRTKLQKEQYPQNGDVSRVSEGDGADAVANGDVSNPKPISTGSRRSRSKSASKRKQLGAQKSTLDKFAESCWRFTYYLFIFIFGVVVLWDKPWFLDSSHCWYGYPFQPLSNDVWWYYMIEMSFYWSLTFSQFVDVQRKDFWVNFVHHIATIFLMCFSWADNFIRPGTLMLAIHDAADFWMEAAKMARYCNRSKLSLILFVIFTIVWFVTRLGVFPYTLVLPGIIDAPALIRFFAAYYVFNMLVSVLLILHIFWSIMILRIVVFTIKVGEPDDVRSDDEDDDGDAEEDSKEARKVR